MLKLLKSVTVLGSTGSIGQSTLDVIRRWPERLGVFALAAGRNTDLLARQITEFRPAMVSVATQEAADDLTAKLAGMGLDRRDWPQIGWGARARVEAATASEANFVLSAIVGIEGLEATYEAILAGKQIGLANKETLVAGGRLVMGAAKQAGVELIPVDSEHNGAHQCLRAGRREEALRLILTASGGPFRETPAGSLASVTPSQALRHPTWQMGPRITIDSATLMNKGFEVIEACWLFDFQPKEVGVVVHPQSSVHALVEFLDGSIVAQASATDMRMPIQYALLYPERAAAPSPRLDMELLRTWNFYPADHERFPLLRLAYQSQETGGSAGCTLNAADEVAVEAFLEERIPFTGIAEVVSETLGRLPTREMKSVGDLLECDSESRRTARECVRQRVAVGA